MLKAFKAQLKAMANDPRDPFSREIQKLAGPEAAPHYKQPLRRMVLSLPDMLSQIRRWKDIDGVGPQRRRLHDFVLAYLYNPTDILPEKTRGFFGYVDDAYLVAGAYQRTVDSEDWADLRPAVSDVELSLHIPDWMRMTQELLPRETAQIDKMLDVIEEEKVRRRAFAGVR